MGILSMSNDGLRVDWNYELTEDSELQQNVSGVDDGIAWGHTGQLEATGVTACIAIGAYDHSSGNGYLTHLKTHKKTKEEFAQDLMEFDTALEDHNIDYESTEIAMVGLNQTSDISEEFLDDPSELEEVGSNGGKKETARIYAEQTFDETNIHWGAEELHMDLDDGTIEWYEDSTYT